MGKQNGFGRDTVNAGLGRRAFGSIPAYGCTLILLSLLSLAGNSRADHRVGNPKLQKTRIWEACCRDRDCVPQPISISDEERQGRIPIEIEKSTILVKKGKFFPVPSPHTWVCYFDRNGEMNDENIRCVLYPKNDSVGSQQNDAHRIRAISHRRR